MDFLLLIEWILMDFLVCSDEEMEEANPVEANDSDYDPTKDAKKEVKAHKVLAGHT